MGADLGRNLSPWFRSLKYAIGFFARTITAKGRTSSVIEGNGDDQAPRKSRLQDPVNRQVPAGADLAEKQKL